MAIHDPSVDRASHEARIRKIFERYQKTRSRWLRDVLVRQYFELVNKVVFSARFRGMIRFEGVEDLKQIGRIGLMRAVERYDLTRHKGSFTAYAWRYIAGEILKHVISQRSVMNTVRFDDAKVRRGRGRGESTTLLNFLAAKSSDHLELGTKLSVGQEGSMRDLANHLPETQRTIIELLFFQDVPLHEVADRLGISPQEVGTLRHEATKQLREWLENVDATSKLPPQEVGLRTLPSRLSRDAMEEENDHTSKAQEGPDRLVSEDEKAVVVEPSKPQISEGADRVRRDVLLRELFLQYQNQKKPDPELRDHLIKMHLHLIYEVIEVLRGKGIEFPLMHEVGCFGLIKAVLHYNPRRRMEFKAYARRMILTALLHCHRDRLGERWPGWIYDLGSRASVYAPALSVDDAMFSDITSPYVAQKSMRAWFARLGLHRPSMTFRHFRATSDRNAETSEPERGVSEVASKGLQGFIRDRSAMQRVLLAAVGPSGSDGVVVSGEAWKEAIRQVAKTPKASGQATGQVLRQMERAGYVVRASKDGTQGFHIGSEGKALLSAGASQPPTPQRSMPPTIVAPQIELHTALKEIYPLACAAPRLREIAEQRRDLHRQLAELLEEERKVLETISPEAWVALTHALRHLESLGERG